MLDQHNSSRTPPDAAKNFFMCATNTRAGNSVQKASRPELNLIVFADLGSFSSSLGSRSVFLFSFSRSQSQLMLGKRAVRLHQFASTAFRAITVKC
jgi:hypothetical protein